MSKLADWRKSKGWSQAKLGEELGGISSVSVGRYEAGRLPEPPIMQKIIDLSSGEVTANDWFEIPKKQAA